MISGGIKFFEKSKSLFADGASISTSSGGGAAQYAIDQNRITKWRSVGSGDTITETITITLSETTAIDRIFLIDHNFKEFTVKYDLGGVPTDFANVLGLDGSLGSGISETAFADSTAYYEFDEVTIDTIYIEVLKTQVADAEKYINQILATQEVGTLQGYPRIRNLELNRNLRARKVLSGKKIIEPSQESFKVRLQFRNYPRSLSADYELFRTLYKADDPFLIWICGGRRGADFYGTNGTQMQGYRLEDIYQVFFEKPVKPLYSKNVYSNGLNFQMDLHEAV